MDKIVRFKNGYLRLTDDGVTILKRNYNHKILYSEIKEVGIVKANIFRRGVLYINDGNDGDEYVSIHDKNRTLTYGFTDNVVIARLVYKIEKMSSIESDTEFSGIKASLYEKIRLINPVMVAACLWVFSLISLLRSSVAEMAVAFFNGDLARLVIGTQTVDDGIFGIFLIASIIFVFAFIIWTVGAIADGVGARRELKKSV